MRYLVTGVASFIASHLAEVLLKEGYQTAFLEEKIQVGLCDGLAAEWKWIQTVYKNY